MFERVLVANRGAVARRVIRACTELGIASVAVYSEADADAPYLEEASSAFPLGGAQPRASYLDIAALERAIRASGADAVHPGYGFLAENADFARAVTRAGATWIGPAPQWLETMAHKTRARALMAEHGLTVGPASGVITDADAAISAVRTLGYPVLVKPVGGGGGIGMVVARDDDALRAALDQASAVAERSFADGRVYLEPLHERPRHIEFQLLADQYGHVRHLYERDCSIQRRHQKVVEQAPAPGLPRDEVEARAAEAAGALAALGYDNLATVEMLRGESGAYTFLEVNTRLQVEHGVTELATGVDLVRAQILLAAGWALDAAVPPLARLSGVAVEARVYAEDPRRFFPSPGPLKVFRPPRVGGVRVDTGYAEGQSVTPYYDPLLAKVIVRGRDSDAALGRLRDALEAFEITGITHNIPALLRLLDDPAFRAGRVHTDLLREVVTS